MAHDPPAIALHGGDEPWPLAGHVRGALTGRGCAVAYAGRLDPASDPQVGWRRGRALDAALRRAGPPEGDRRRVLAVLWGRLEAVPDLQGLSLLLASRDASGVALSAVGIGRIYAPRDGALHTWVAGEHPLLGPPGLPAAMPGALVLGGLPGWLVATCHGSPRSLDGVGLSAVFPRCGVHG